MCGPKRGSLITLEMKGAPMVYQQYPGVLMIFLTAWMSDVTSFSLNSLVERIIGSFASTGTKWSDFKLVRLDVFSKQ